MYIKVYQNNRCESYYSFKYFKNYCLLEASLIDSNDIIIAISDSLNLDDIIVFNFGMIQEGFNNTFYVPSEDYSATMWFKSDELGNLLPIELIISY